MEKIKEEMEVLKQERLMIDREMKLFNFHFFSMLNKEGGGMFKGGLNQINGLNHQFGGFNVNQGQQQ